ncbi:hypothetical protein [Microbacterium sp. NPDC089188]|uniref:hypothetical protein n=1 Tax=Microbacterium sp. NPDC089188 TaxID=3154971 RepID=UPI003419B6F4
MTDLSALNLAGLLTRATSQGPGVDDDTATVATGVVLDVDTDARRVRVGIRGGDVWLPAVAGRYARTGPARVLIDPTTSRPVLALGPSRPLPPVIPATVTGVTDARVLVTFDGGAFTVPSVTGVYEVGGTAWVMLDDWGRPAIALGPSVEPPPAQPLPPVPAQDAVVTATVTIAPQVSGTYSLRESAWDQWHTDRHDGRADIYQGDAAGSGQLRGFAGYGDQIANLGALSIDSAVLTVRRVAEAGSGSLTVRGTTHGTRPEGEPTDGAFALASSEQIPAGGVGSIDLPATLRESMRTGDARGLVAVGTAYGGFGGTATPGSFTLAIRYTKAA